MTHLASTPKHTTKKPTIPSSSCSSTRTRDGATSTGAPSDEAGVGEHQNRRPDRRDGALQLVELAQQGALLGQEGA
jgi:hypothetical protein